MVSFVYFSLFWVRKYTVDAKSTLWTKKKYTVDQKIHGLMYLGPYLLSYLGARATKDTIWHLKWLQLCTFGHLHSELLGYKMYFVKVRCRVRALNDSSYVT